MSILTEQEKTTYLSFCLAGDVFALEVGHVREVLDMVELTRIPRMPEYVRGVINLRGSVVPVIDMRSRFEMEAVHDTVDTCIIVVEAELSGQAAQVGVLVDSVQAVCEIRAEDIEPPPGIGMNLNTRYVKGMGKQDDRFIIILDLDRLFADEDIHMLPHLGETDTAGKGIMIDLG